MAHTRLRQQFQPQAQLGQTSPVLQHLHQRHPARNGIRHRDNLGRLTLVRANGSPFQDSNSVIVSIAVSCQPTLQGFQSLPSSNSFMRVFRLYFEHLQVVFCHGRVFVVLNPKPSIDPIYEGKHAINQNGRLLASQRICNLATSDIHGY
jgi:hypothetical protein